MNERLRRERRIERQIARRIEKRHGRRINATLNGGTIRNGRVMSPDGVDMSHRYEILPVKAESAKRYVRNRSAIGEFSAENGGYVWGLFKSSVTMEAQWSEKYGLTQSDFARLMFIGTYIDYDGVLRHPNGKLITRESMAELIGLHQTKFDEFFAKLAAVPIIEVAEDGAIYMSSDVFQRGKIAKGEYVDRIRIYRDTVRSLYEKYGKGRSVRQLGIVYSVIPFVHRNMNIVCYNPLEKHEDDVKPLTLDKLALILGYQNATKFKAALRAIEINGQPVFAFVEDIHDNRKRRIVVNPRVVFAGDFEGLQACRALVVLFN